RSEKMEPGISGFLGVADVPKLAIAGNFAGVADLAAHLGVKRRSVKDECGFVFYADNFEDFRWRFEFFIADELSRCCGFNLGEFNDFFFLSSAGASFLFSHQPVKSRFVHAQPVFSGHEFGEVEWKTIRVIKFERESTTHG